MEFWLNKVIIHIYLKKQETLHTYFSKKKCKYCVQFIIFHNDLRLKKMLYILK